MPPPLTLPESWVAAFLRFAVKPVLGPPFPVAARRWWLTTVSRLAPPPSGVREEPFPLSGVPAQVFTPTSGAIPGAPVILHLHGGAFTFGSPQTHRGIAGFLARATNGAVYVPGYRLAPEHPYPAGRYDALTAYVTLLDEGVAPEHLLISGDSSGALMALDLVLDVEEAGLPAPAGVVLISPGLRLDRLYEHRHGVQDTLVRRRGALAAIRDYRRPLDEPAHAALDRDLTALPPVMVQYGVDEYLAPDAVRVVADLREAGVRTVVYPQDGAFHGLATMVGTLPRARAAARQIADFSLRCVALRS